METYSELRIYHHSLMMLIGMKEALFICNLHYYLKISKNINEGRKWSYRTLEEWESQLPYCKRTIQRIIATLTKKKILLKANYNKWSADQTVWYSLDYNTIPLTPDWPNFRGDSQTPPVDKLSHSQMDNLSTPLPFKYHSPTEENILYIDLDKLAYGLNKISLTHEQYNDLLGRAITESILIKKLQEFQNWKMNLSKPFNGNDYETMIGFLAPKKINLPAEHTQPQNQNFDNGRGFMNDMANYMAANGFSPDGSSSK